MYFENLNNIINSIKDRFNQTDYQIYVNLPKILIKAFKKQDWEDDLRKIKQNYGVNEFYVPSLKARLLLLPEIAQFYGLDSRMQVSEMIALFKKLDIIKRLLVAEVIKLVNFLAINAVNERDHFCLLKELKLIFAQQQQIIG